MQEEAKNDPIRSLFKTSREIAEEAYQNILNYQNKVFKPAKTGYDYLDEALLGGLYPQNAIAIGARTGVGKSYVAQKVVETIMNPFINPQSQDYLLVNCEFEMNPMDILARRISRETGKPIRQILLEKQTSLEEKKILEIVEKEKRDNIVYIPRPVTPEELEAAINMVMSGNMHRKLVVFKIDHIALINRNGGDPKRVMDNAVAVINNAKLNYPNIAFIIISQFNRDIESRRSPKEHAPRLSDFYQSDELGQLCSLMVGLNNPRRLGYEEYMWFPSNWYQSLDKFKPVSKKTTFRTEGLLFHHILKVRQIRIEELENTIYPEIMPGYGWMYGEGGVKYVNMNQPPEPASFEHDENGEIFDDSPYD